MFASVRSSSANRMFFQIAALILNAFQLGSLRHVASGGISSPYDLKLWEVRGSRIFNCQASCVDALCSSIESVGIALRSVQYMPFGD
jgi:hypothetical protein